KGTISSPNYPLAYPANTVCTWKIEVPLNKRIVLDCQEPFHIQSLPEKCLNDFLAVSTTGDESFKNARRFCWTQEPQTLSSVKNVMTVLFKSNSWYQTSGFRCEFTYATIKK
uniref:CUB domain-containing protein n=1 Tax=Strigamia maritima TaxID=126957 RepID=T1JMZ8_STRMM